jgi:hypothetical protein
MIDTKELFKTKKFPRWFQNHPIFKEIKTIKKVFPGIGLPNCETEVELDNSAPAEKSAKALVRAISSNLRIRSNEVAQYVLQPHIADDRKAHGTKCVALLGAVKQTLRAPKNVIQKTDGRIAIKLPSDITPEGEQKHIFRKNESLFRVYNKLSELLRERRFTALPRLEDMDTFKTFSTENIPNNKFKVVFSSDGVDGAWDVATMSCRGIRSCQSWDGGEYKHCTIGSIIDPFVGIIYMTSGGKYNQYGSKMIKRCLVRFAIDGKTSNPFLLIDRMYPSYDAGTLTHFKSLLKKRTGDKLGIYYADNCGADIVNQAYLPLNPIREKLKKTSIDGKNKNPADDYYSTIQSYQDMHLQEKRGNKKDKQAELFDKNSKRKVDKFVSSFAQDLSSVMKTADFSNLPRTLTPTMNKLTGKDRYGNYSYLLNNIGADIAKYIIESVDKKAFTNSDTYMRRIYYAYFNQKRKIIQDNRTNLTKFINGQLGLKPGERFGVRTIVAMMEAIYPELDKAIKTHLRELVAKRKFSGVMPLP